MSFKNDLSGITLGRLTVLRYSGRHSSGQSLWVCKCACGGEKVVVSGNFLRGNTLSCGCYLKECRVNRVLKHGASRAGKHTGEYKSWSAAKHRCFDVKGERYHRYGGRGITMCDEWRNSFPAFLAHMGPRPDGFTLDRIDNSKGYEPGNCRWATYKQQAQNRS